jgi:hypothetical protein
MSVFGLVVQPNRILSRTIERKDSMRGELDTGGLGDARFTGKRKEPEAKIP